jgi:hypothetical protein
MGRHGLAGIAMDLNRSLEQRKRDTLYRLAHDKDLWAASGNLEGRPYLVPLSFWWNGEYLFIATAKKNATARNMIETRRVRVALGNTRDVVLIDASAKPLQHEELPVEYGDAYVTKCGWDPRKSKLYRFFRLEPQRIEVWREWNEHADRGLMSNGQWLV